MNLEKWFESNKSLISLGVSFVTLASVFGVLWAVVIIVTIFLLDNAQNIDLEHSIGEEILKKKIIPTHRLRPYSAGISGINKEEISVNEKKTVTMLFSSGMKKNRSGNPSNTNRVNSEPKPSLMSLIHGKNSTPGRKENHRPRNQQPLLAVVKNNIHLRRSSLTDSFPKSPLYRNIQSPVLGRTCATNSPLSALSNTTYNRTLNDTYNHSLYQSPNKSFTEHNASLSEGLEVHGAYFVNKSLLHDEKIEEFSLVNKNFCSPVKIANQANASVLKSSYVNDSTATESVVSALKEKSKRKRRTQPSEDQASTKKARFSDDAFDSTLNELFPPMTSSANPEQKKSFRITKKRFVSTSTQCKSSPEENEVKKVKRNESPSRSKFGLTEQQADSMMDDESIDAGDGAVSDHTSSKANKAVLEQAVEHVKDSLQRYPGSTEKKVSFVTSKMEKDSEDGKPGTDFKISALKSIKSPYKKILNTSFPSNLKPGSTEKRRKHPVFFTAKIDIDEIQNNREEYGERGASLKAFRHDQEDAAKRVDDLLNESSEASDAKSVAPKPLTSTLTSSATNPLLNAASLSTAATSKSSGLLAALGKPLPSVPTISFSSATPVSTTGFSFSTAAVSSSSGFSSGFSFPTNVTSSAASASSVASPAASLTYSDKTVSFALNSQAAASQANVNFNFGNKTVSSTGSTNPTSLSTSTPLPSEKLSVGGATNQNSSSAVSFSFGAPATTQPASFSFGTVKPAISVTSINSAAAPSFSFGQPSATAVSSNPSVLSNLTKNESGTVNLQNTAVTATNTASINTAKGFSLSAAGQAQAAATNISFGALQSTGVSSTTAVSSAVNKNLFGTTTTTGTFSFGTNPAVSAAQSTLNITGNGNNFSANVIAAPVKPVAAAPPSVFGAPTSSTAQPSAFGVPTSSTGATNIFAAPASKSATGFTFPTTTSSTSITGFNFNAAGTQSQATTSAPSIFAAPTSSANLFGKSGTQGQNVFGNASAQSSAPSSQSVFGTVTSNVAKTTNGFADTGKSNIFGAAATSNVFGTPATQTSSGLSNVSVFGSTAQANVFGNTSSNPTNVFGSAATTQANVFGSASAAKANVFGSAPTTQANVFGGAPAAQANIFGSAPATQANVFGNAPATQANVFGATPSQNTFGNSASSVFGQKTSASSGFQFGSTTTTAASTGFQFGSTSSSKASTGFQFGSTTTSAASQSSGGFNFGASSNSNSQKSVFGQASTGNVFGAGNNSNVNAFGATNNASNLFGSSSTNTNAFGATANNSNAFGSSAASVFGAPAASTNSNTNPFGQDQKPTGGFDFSSSLKQGPTMNFGAPANNNAFGAQAAVPKPFNFSNQPGTPTFGSNPPTPSFGTPAQPNFGTPPAGGFTIGSGATNPPRQTQRARRRLRK